VQHCLGRYLQLFRFVGRGLPRSQQRVDRVQPYRWRGHQDRQDDPLQQSHRRTSQPHSPSAHAPWVSLVGSRNVVTDHCIASQGFSPTQLRLTLSMEAPELSQPFSISYPLGTLPAPCRPLGPRSSRPNADLTLPHRLHRDPEHCAQQVRSRHPEEYAPLPTLQYAVAKVATAEVMMANCGVPHRQRAVRRSLLVL